MNVYQAPIIVAMVALAFLRTGDAYAQSAASAASAATYYVSPLRSDRNSGASQEQPFQKVQHAIDTMKAGDALVVFNGFYTGTLKLRK